MKESVEAARTVVRSRSRRLGITDEVFEKKDIHIHVPDGATPKDGPSAGAAMTTAIVSALTGIPVRADVAMTGEITLRGEVTAIGGLKEKLLAALRGGIKTVLIPEENAKDLQEIPGEREERPGDRAGEVDRQGAGGGAGAPAHAVARRRAGGRGGAARAARPKARSRRHCRCRSSTEALAAEPRKIAL